MGNARKSFRYPAHIAQRSAILHAGELRLDAAIVDESEGGLGIIVADPSSLSVGQMAQLEEIEAAVPVRPVRVKFITPDEYEVFRVGLEMLTSQDA